MKQMNVQGFRKLLTDKLVPTEKEIVYIAILSMFFIFLSFIGHTRVEPNPEAGRGFVNVFYGFPLEWFKITANEGSWFSSLTKTHILWIGLAVDAVLFIMLSLFLVRVVDKVSDYARPKMA